MSTTNSSTEAPKSPDKVSETTRAHTYGTWRKQGTWKPLNIVEAQGCSFTDSAGKRYLDFSSQLVSSNLGHGNKAVMDAIAKQASSLPYLNPVFTCPIRAEAATALAEVFPKGLDKFFFSTSGTEANEAAVKIARTFTGKRKIISRYTSYHGSTAGSMALTGDFRRWFTEGLGAADGVVFGPDAYCYRCPLGQTYPECGVACADYIDYMIKKESDVAAVIVEPIVGTNGVIVPPDEYLPMLRENTEKHGVLLIADEVMTGWGRTGEWFAVNHWKVTPDMITTAKGSTGAYVPLGITATSKRISEFFDSHPFPHGHTYEAHPVSLSAVPAAISEYRRLSLLEKAKRDGPYMKEKLTDLANRHPCIGDVRGMGLFWAIELVKNRKTKEPLNEPKDKFEGKPLAIDDLTSRLMAKGVYVMGWISHLVLAPPLIVARGEIDMAINTIDAELTLTDQLTS